MTILQRLFASGGEEIAFDTLTIVANRNTYRLVDEYEDKTLGGETFTACAMSLKLPKRNTDGAQSLKFTLSNINGTSSAEIRTALENQTGITVQYQKFTSDDTMTAAESYTMDLKSATWTNLQIELTCNYMGIIDTAWPRNRYTLIFSPGIRWL